MNLLILKTKELIGDLTPNLIYQNGLEEPCVKEGNE